MRPFLGIQSVLMGDQLFPAVPVLRGNAVSGSLRLRQPWRRMAQTIYGDPQRFLDSYFGPFPGLYFTGDGAFRSEDGFYQITGRMDDIIDISGHWLGTALDKHPAVPLHIKGEGETMCSRPGGHPETS